MWLKIDGSGWNFDIKVKKWNLVKSNNTLLRDLWHIYLTYYICKMLKIVSYMLFNCFQLSMSSEWSELGQYEQNLTIFFIFSRFFMFWHPVYISHICIYPHTCVIYLIGWSTYHLIGIESIFCNENNFFYNIEYTF